MKKPVKISLITIAAVVIIAVALVGGVVLKAKSELKKMHALKTEKVVENVFAINCGTVNLFLVKDSDSYIAIDAGADKELIKSGLKQLNIDPSKVKALLLTHTDFDHTAALDLFPNAELRLSKDEEQMINGKKARSFGITHNSIGGRKYTLIQDGEVFNIGNLTIKGILTPGHTTGAMCYLVNNQFLFIGDAASLHAGKIAPFNKFFNRDDHQAIESMSKITHLQGVKYILSAHYGFADYSEAVRNWPENN